MKESINSFNERETEIRLDNTSELLQELEKYKDEGNSLYKEKKIEEAKLKFKEGYEKYEKEIHQIKKDFPESPKLNEIEIVLNKMAKTAEKYPVSKSKGVSTKYTNYD